MRLEGHSPSVIAATLGLSAGTVRAHIHRYPEIPNTKLCKNCGKPVLQAEKRREKKFCSDSCRMLWWNTHQDSVNRKAYYNLTCEYCGTSHALRSRTLLLRNNDTAVDTIVSTAVSVLVGVFIRDLLKIQVKPASNIVFYALHLA